MKEYEFFFGGPLSQWFRSPFKIKDMTFVTAEQWMMYNKAMMFGDEKSAKEIMSTEDPLEQKMIGRNVKNFNDSTWMEKAYDIVVAGTREKFNQNKELLDYLKKTRGKIIAEASATDTRWGIGLVPGHPDILDQSKWKGQNLLGKAIMQVRSELFGE